MLCHHFPNVMQIFSYLNTGYFKTRSGKGRNKKRNGDLNCPFAIFAQGIESWFFLDNVCKELYLKYDDIPLFTVHDSILTTEPYVEKVESMITRLSNEIFGFTLRTSN